MVYLVHLGEMLFTHVKTFHPRVKFIGIVYGLRSGGRGRGRGGVVMGKVKIVFSSTIYPVVAVLTDRHFDCFHS